MTEDVIQQTMSDVGAIVRRSALLEHYDTPDAAAMVMVMTVCLHLGVDVQDIPATLLEALAHLHEVTGDAR